MMADIETALQLIASHSELADFVGPRDENIISAAEAALGLVFPATYRHFLSELGAGSFGHDELFGVIDEDFESSMAPDGIWLTLKLRREGFADDLVVVLHEDDGAYYFLATSRSPRGSSECPVVAWNPEEAIAHDMTVVARGYGEFLRQRIEQQLVRHRGS